VPPRARWVIDPPTKRVPAYRHLLEKNPAMTLLADLLATSGRVQETRSPSAKVAALAGFLARPDAGEVGGAVAFLPGDTPRGQGGRRSRGRRSAGGHARRRPSARGVHCAG